MNKHQLDVLEFMRAMNQDIGNPQNPSIQKGELRCSLITEEAKEFEEAVKKDNLVGAIDAICDLLYVTYGAAITFGIDISAFFETVHRANMLKTTGPVRADGKRLKPEGWEPPKMKELLELYTQWTRFWVV